MSGRRLKVLYLIDHLYNTGGAERLALGLATRLPQDRFEPWVCFTRGADREALRELAARGIPFTSTLRRAKWDVHRLISLGALLRRERFDVLHSHAFGSNVWGTLFGRACHVPVVIAHEHTWSYEGRPLRKLLDGRVIGRLATRFVAVSRADAERMVSIERVPASKVVVIPNGYVPRDTNGGLDIRAELGLAAGTPLVATAALMRPQKALEVLIDAHARVLAQVPEAHLVLAGDGECRGALEERIRRHGIEPAVHLLGRRNDVEAILAQTTVAALSSDYEGMPLFAFESAASATPLVATAVGALPDLFEDGVSALLVPARDDAALAAGIVRLLQDDVLRAGMGAAAREQLAPYSIEAVADRFADLYEELFAEARP